MQEGPGQDLEFTPEVFVNEVTQYWCVIDKGLDLASYDGIQTILRLLVSSIRNPIFPKVSLAWIRTIESLRPPPY